MTNYLNKKTLIANCAEQTNLPKARVKEVIEALEMEISAHLKEGVKVQIPGFGLVKPFVRQPRLMKGLGKEYVTKPALGVRIVLIPELRQADVSDVEEAI